MIYNSFPLDPEGGQPAAEALVAKTCKGVEAEILKAMARAPGG
ncbi:hypothetical protein [Polaromonas sp. YR568]